MGKLVSKGTVEQIKRKFGIGYNISITNTENNEQMSEFEAYILDRIPGSFKDDKKSNF
jgi:hypothetical protein